jgi:hypothetical protein
MSLFNMTLTGHVDEISRSRVIGWVYDADCPAEPVSVSIFVNGELRGSCPATAARPDLALSTDQIVTTDCAFEFTFEPPLSPFIELQVEVVETWSAQPMPNGRRVLPCPGGSAPQAGLVPVLVTSTGRAGTTLLMSEFARHKDIVVGDRYPYEIKQIAYHIAAFRALVADADRQRSTVPETMLDRDMTHVIGSNPFNMAGLFDLGTSGESLRDFYHSSVPAGYATLYRGLIAEFYTTLAAAQGKHTARLFCEKGDVDEAVVQGARLFFGGAKEIVLVRDPRDLLCSAIAFWRLTPPVAMSMLRTTFPRLIQAARQAGPDTIVVRYEDMVREPVTIRRALSGFLGVDLLATPAGDGLRSKSRGNADAVVSSHRTSQDAATSIGRWRQDLTPEQIRECELAFGPSMREFDYEAPTGEPRSAPTGARATVGRAASFTPRRMEGENQIVAAEGTAAVSALLDDDLSSQGGRSVMELTFGRAGSGKSFLLGGWSGPERDFIWSCEHESRLRLPAIGRPGTYQLRIVGQPFVHGTVLPAQRVTVLLDGTEAGAARVRDICTLIIPVPETMTEAGQPITVTLQLPDAARPSEAGTATDHRLLGFALYSVALIRVDAVREANSQALGRPVAYVGAPVEIPPILALEWRAAAGA